jgi:hypothetical protein
MHGSTSSYNGRATKDENALPAGLHLHKPSFANPLPMARQEERRMYKYHN